MNKGMTARPEVTYCSRVAENAATSSENVGDHRWCRAMLIDDAGGAPDLRSSQKSSKLFCQVAGDTTFRMPNGLCAAQIVDEIEYCQSR